MHASDLISVRRLLLSLLLVGPLGTIVHTAMSAERDKPDVKAWAAFSRAVNMHGKSWLYRGSREGRASIESKVHAERTEIEFHDVPLRDGMEFLSELHEIPFRIDAKALERAQIDPELPISDRFTALTLESALNLILEPRKLDWLVEDGGIAVTTADVAAGTLTTHSYSLELLKHPLGDKSLVEVTPEEALKLVRAVLDATPVKAKDGPVVVRADEDEILVRHNRRGHARLEGLLEEMHTDAVKAAAMKKYIQSHAGPKR